MDLNKLESLKRGKVYEIWHKRKGHFIAKLVNVIPNDEGDKQDDFLIHVMYDVRLGTDQYNMNVTGKQSVRESRLRPSLIRDILEYKEDNWLREVEIPLDPPEKEGLVQKTISKLFGGN